LAARSAANLFLVLRLVTAIQIQKLPQPCDRSSLCKKLKINESEINSKSY
jgi:hypothetical protein